MTGDPDMTFPRMRPYEYTLVGHTPIACGDTMSWAMEKRKASRQAQETGVDPWRVGFDDVGDRCEVSTVFLGIDHGFGSREPILFETMVFGGPLDGQQARYSTWADAARGHAAMVEIVRKAVAQVGDIWQRAHRKRASKGWRKHVRRVKARRRQ